MHLWWRLCRCALTMSTQNFHGLKTRFITDALFLLHIVEHHFRFFKLEETSKNGKHTAIEDNVNHCTSRRRGKSAVHVWVQEGETYTRQTRQSLLTPACAARSVQTNFRTFFFSPSSSPPSSASGAVTPAFLFPTEPQFFALCACVPCEWWENSEHSIVSDLWSSSSVNDCSGYIAKDVFPEN